MDVSLGIIFGIIAMVCWGTADFFVANAVKKTNVLKVLLWSQITSMIFFMIIFSFFFNFPVLSPVIIGIILVNAFLSVISWGSYYKGFEIGKVSVISPVTNSWPVVTVILSLIFLGEALTPMQAAGVILAISGAILTSFKLKDLAKLKNPAKGVKYAIVGVFGWGIFFLLLDVLVSDLGWILPLLLIKAVSVFYIAAYFKTTKRKFSFPKKVMIFVILVGVFEAIATLSYGLGITFQYTAIVAPIMAAVPMVTVILARIFMKETMETNQKIGIVSILIGLVLLSI